MSSCSFSSLSKSLFCIGLSGGLFLLAGVSAQANVVLTTASGTLGADSYVAQGSTTTNFGTDFTVKSKNNTDTTDRLLYMRFDISSVSDLVTGGSLTLKASTDTGDTVGTLPAESFSLFVLTDQDWDNWVESGLGGITWSNAPARLGSSDTFDASMAVQIATGTTTAGASSLTFTLDSSIGTYITADTNDMLTLMIRRNTNAATTDSFFSKEDTNPLAVAPTLSLTTVPEPSSIPALFLGLAALLVRRRR